MTDSVEQLDDFADDASDGDTPAAVKAGAPPASPLIGFIQKLKGKKSAVSEVEEGEAEDDTPVPVVASGAAVAKPVAAGPVKMPAGPLVTVMMRNEFYRDGFRKLLWVALLQVISIVGLLIAFISFVTTGESQDRYFATTADGRIMQLTPLDQPGNMTTAALMSWVALATTEVMTFGYNDYQRRLQQSARHFTHYGWETFTGALQASRIIDGMLANKELLTTTPRSAPVLVQEGVFNGKYRWVVKLPLQISYGGNAQTARSTSINVMLVIERVPSLENPSGVGIAQWVASQG